MTRPHRVVATAGHVDHGKSTLVRALTGMEPDRLAEERLRGLTIDLGFAWTDLATPDAPDAPTVAFVDVPGHERFVPTMLAGAGAAPAALLVVAADGGWSAQTTEHRDVLELLHVPLLAVVLTRTVLADDDLAEIALDEIAEQLEGTSLASAPVVHTDALAGIGLDELREVLRTRLGELPPPPDLGRPRLWVDRAFTVAGAGTVVTGTSGGGTLRVGDAVQVLPGGRQGRVRGLQSLGTPVGEAAPGSRVAVNLQGISHAEVERGAAVVGAGAWRATRELDAVVRVLPGRTVSRTGAWHLHVGSARSTCQLRPLDGPLEGPVDGVVRVLLDQPLPVVAGDRLVLRDAGPRATVAGGVVADPDPGRRPRSTDARERRRELLGVVAAAGGPADRTRGLLELRGGSAPAVRLLAAAGAHAEPLPDGVRRVGEALATDPAVESWATAVRALGVGTHEARTVAATARGAGAHPDAAEALADHLVVEGILTRVTGGYALREHAAATDDARERRAAAVVRELAAGGLQPPEIEPVARAEGLDHRELALLVASGDVVRCGKVTFARTAVEEAVATLRTVEAEVGPFTAAQAKDAWGTTRRFAIPLLEHLDRTGVTAFDGTLRQMR